MKSIFCLILAVLTWGESVEAYWNLMRAGRYDEAAAKIETYINEGRHVSETERVEAAAMMQKAQLCHEMNETTRKVDIVDSIKVTKNRMVATCSMIIANSSATRGNKRLMSVNGDIYRQYGDDEKERLSARVNTEKNEQYPFEMSDGVTLYFSSEGHGSIGGYDIFRTKYNSETFDYSEPQNVGMPFNTLGNDYLMMADDIAGLGLWATDWRQTGDTVAVYVYRLADSDAGDTVRKTALQVDEEEEAIRFVVNDTIVYTNIEAFRSAEARSLYMEMKELEKEMSIVQMLLDGMRITIRDAQSDDELSSLSRDIAENEQYVLGLRQRLRDAAKMIRQLEIKQYE